MVRKESLRSRKVGDVVVFDMPNLSKIAWQYQKLRVSKIPLPISEEPLVIIEDREGIRVNSEELKKVYAAIDKKIVEQGPSFLVEREALLREIFLNQLTAAENGKLDGRSLIGSMSDYGALNLESLIQRDYIWSCLNGDKEIFNWLLVPSSGMSYHHEIYIGLVKLSEDFFYDEHFNSDSSSLREFIKTFGFLTAMDTTLGYLEEPTEVINIVSKMPKPLYRQGDGEIEEIAHEEIEEIAQIKFNALLTRNCRERAVKKICARADNPEKAKELCDYDTLAIDYGENNHRFRTRMYRCFREAMERRGLDVMNTCFEDV